MDSSDPVAELCQGWGLLALALALGSVCVLAMFRPPARAVDCAAQEVSPWERACPDVESFPFFLWLLSNFSTRRIYGSRRSRCRNRRP